ncbi:hypothetical protein GGI20_002681 [Coemansia sp. BCRC 34301]|nr:hypothetical protein GGI20_002681 [Coemansia sp. BCRC 34301]
MDRATLPSIPWIRTLDNEVIGDILYYFSTYHGHEMLALVIGKLNTAYRDFISTHPCFQGPVSLIAHSLGGLVCYEILYYMRQLEEAQKRGVDVRDLVNPRERERYRDLPKLAFSPDRLFSMGSPMGATLVFRNLTFAEYLIPASVGYHNIFHPYDPFGYRTEPLADDYYEDTPAVPITADTFASSSATSVVSKFGGRRMTLGGSMADLGKTFVGAMATAPASFSSTVIRAAKTSVTLPISAIMNGKHNEPRPQHRRKLSLFGSSSTTALATPEDGDGSRRRHSLSKLLPSLMSFSFSGNHRSSKSNASSSSVAVDVTHACLSSAIAEEGPIPPAHNNNDDEDQGEEGSSTPESSLSFSCTSHVAATISAMVVESPAPGGGEHREAAPTSSTTATSSASDPEDEADGDDAMLSHIMRIFKVARTPTREQQIAEAQGLPLSSRLMARTTATRANSSAPHEFASRPIRSAHAYSGQSSQVVEATAGLGSGTVPTLRRYSTMPPVLPLGEHSRATTEEKELSEPRSDSPASAAEQSSPAKDSEEETPTTAAKLAHRLPYTERMDYIIPFSKSHLQNEYWLGFQAHFSYWTSKDVVHHILYHMVRKPISSKS